MDINELEDGEPRNKIIECQDCGIRFAFALGEQDWFKERNYPDPIRCRECRTKRKLYRRKD